MSTIKNALHLALLATSISIGALTSVSAQTTPAPVPPIAPMIAPSTFFNGTLQPSSWLASDAIDEPVLNLKMEKIGEINDLIVDGEGRVIAAIIGIGGFLGVGEKDVAVTFKAIRMSRDDKGKTLLVLDITKDALKDAPSYRPITTAKR